MCRLQFSSDKPTAVDDAVSLISTERLSESSAPSLASVMSTLKTYRSLQEEIAHMKSKEVSFGVLLFIWFRRGWWEGN
jgi:hypothetical protein